MINQGEGISRTFFAVIATIALLVLYSTSLYNYLLFHSLVEFFSIAVACGIFIVAWNSQKFLKNHYLLFLGIAFPFIALLDLIHVLSYGEINIFRGYSSNLPTQLWIAARYLQSITFFVAPFFVFRRINVTGTVFGYISVTAFLFISIFAGIFPDCYIEGSGLTQFKVISEYVISMILAGSIYLLHRKKDGFDPFIYRLLVGSIALTIFSELAFTFYVSVYGFSNLVGHYLKLVAVYLIYKALIETGLREPYNLLFREIKNSELKYRSLFENMIDGFSYHQIVQDDAGKPVDYVFLEVNDAFEHLTGLKKESIIGKPVTEALPGTERDPADWIGVYGKVALRDEEIRFEQYSEALGKWFSISAYSPEKGYFVTVFEDITKRKEAEQAVKESEKKYRELAENSLVGIFKTTISGDILYVNDAMVRMMEFDSSEEMVTEGVLARYRNSADRERLVDTLVKEGSVENFETEILTKSGRAVNVLFNASLEGNVISGMLMDITERKRAEENLKWELSLRKAIADMSSLLINPAFSLDEAAEITREYALSLTESEHGLVTSIDPATGDNVAHTLTSMMNLQAVSADKKIAFAKGENGLYPGLLGHALNTGKAFYTNSPNEHETYRGLPEGHKPIENFLTVPASFGNKIMGQIAIANSKHNYTDRDLYAVERLSELYALAVQQKRVEQELRNSLHEKEMLIKEIHHRMKNNLIVVTSLLKLQSAQAKDKETKELFRTSQNRVRSMSMIHERLYASTDLASIDFGEYLNSLAVQLFHAYEVSQAKVKLQVSADDVRLDVDTVIPCGLMVNELISNALKHAFPDGRSGELYVSLGRDDDNYYTLSVKDNGVGMPPDIDIYRTSSLGMQLVTSLAKQINGKLEVFHDGGTEIRVTFKERTFVKPGSDKKYSATSQH